MTWHEAFRKHLESAGLNQQDALFALRKARVKATASQISYWSRGASYPREELRGKIERWSGGAVPASLPAAADSGTDLTAATAKSA